MFPYTIPDELVRFVTKQFKRFDTRQTTPRTINTLSETVIDYVINNSYFPESQDMAVNRYNKRIPLNHMEKVNFIGSAEPKLKLHYKESPTLAQMHLVSWAALLWCWSLEGEKYVKWISTSKFTA